MKMIKFAAVLCAALFSLLATGAHAQASRTWVSGVGDDVNPCSRTAPCKTFAGAISKTAANGEINCLDPGGFGAVTITKSITIDCTGTFGSILNAATNGVNVNDSATATPGTINVVLRGISINGAGATLGVNGIRFVRGATLTVEQVRIQNFSTAGINIDPSAGSARVVVIDSTIIGSTAASEVGVRIAPTGAATSNVSLLNVAMVRNFRGIDAIGTGTTGVNTVAMFGGTITGSTDLGINGTTNANALNMMFQEISVDNNGGGFSMSGAGGQGRIGSSTMTANAGNNFVVAGGSVIRSFKNNQVDLNNNNGTPRPQVILE
jgi:hypothetical protein